MIPIIITLAISAIHKPVVDSALFPPKFHASIPLIYNNVTFLYCHLNYDIEQSYRRTEFRWKFRGIYCAFMNRRTITPQIKVIAA
jgi:hypothetical protein